MSYVEQSLANNERIIARATFPWTYRLTAWCALIFLGIAIIGIIIFFDMMIRMWTTEIAVTNQRFIFKTGWFSLNTNEIALVNVEGVRVHQSLFGRLFNYGTVHVEGTGVDSATTPSIENPVAFRKALENAKFKAVPEQRTGVPS